MTSGCDAITICDADNSWCTLGCEGLVGGFAVEVVMAGARVCDGSEVCIVVQLWVWWATG